MKKHQSKQNPESALARLMDLCSRSEKSTFEIELKLKEWGLEKHTSSILETLQKENFLNPKRFALAFAHDKVKFNKWGKNKIRFSLRGHRIDQSAIDEALDQINNKDYLLMIQNEMDKKLKSIKAGDAYQKKAKLYAFGNQRGYEADMINQYFDLREL